MREKKTGLGNIHISGDAPPREGGSDQKCHHSVIRGREGSDQSVTWHWERNGVEKEEEDWWWWRRRTRTRRRKIRNKVHYKVRSFAVFIVFITVHVCYNCQRYWQTMGKSAVRAIFNNYIMRMSSVTCHQREGGVWPKCHHGVIIGREGKKKPNFVSPDMWMFPNHLIWTQKTVT